VPRTCNELCAELHNRMPAVLGPETWPAWLGEEPADPRQLKTMLAPYPSDEMNCWPVSARVGYVNNDASPGRTDLSAVNLHKWLAAASVMLALGGCAKVAPGQGPQPLPLERRHDRRQSSRPPCPNKIAALLIGRGSSVHYRRARLDRKTDNKRSGKNHAIAE
jgi:hypothetical protein